MFFLSKRKGEGVVWTFLSPKIRMLWVAPNFSVLHKAILEVSMAASCLILWTYSSFLVISWKLLEPSSVLSPSPLSSQFRDQYTKPFYGLTDSCIIYLESSVILSCSFIISWRPDGTVRRSRRWPGLRTLHTLSRNGEGEKRAVFCYFILEARFFWLA